MVLKVAWQEKSPGRLRTEIVNGVVRVTCQVEDQPPPPPPDGRADEGLQVLYTFQEGSGTTVHDVSGVGEQLDLTIQGEAGASWNANGGLSVNSPLLISSAEPATKVINAVKASNEITIEAWVRPANVTQDGPGRIVSLSHDVELRNFMLGQGRWGDQPADVFDARLRTTETDANGRPSVTTPVGTASPNLTHVVYTRAASGSARIYVNDAEVASKTVGGMAATWEAGYRLALANEFTRDRAWLGEYYLVAIYSRALDAADVSRNFRAGVHAEPEPPAITSKPETIALVGQLYVYRVQATGAPGPTFALATSPAGMTLEATSGLIEWRPTVDQVGSNNVTIVASNGVEPDANQAFAIEVSEPQPEPPSITSTPVTAALVGQRYAYRVEAKGSPEPTYSLTTYPQGMMIEEISGRIEWTPSADQTGLQDVSVVASNGVEPDAVQTFAIETSEPPPEPPPPPPGTLLRNHNFESGDLRGFYWRPNRPEVVTAPHPVRAGAYSMRTYLHRYQSTDKYRTHVIFASNPNLPPGQSGTPFYFTVGGEYWMGFSVYIPDSFKPDRAGMSDILLECQATPDSGETYRQPVLCLGLNESQWMMWSKWDSRSFTPASAGTASFEGTKTWHFPLGSSVGKWTDWVIHIKWHYTSAGLLEVWKDGERIINRTGPNCSNDAKGPHMALGVYKWSWKPKHNPPYPSNIDSRLFYYDEFRIGGANASYNDVAPGW